MRSSNEAAVVIRMPRAPMSESQLIERIEGAVQREVRRRVADPAIVEELRQEALLAMLLAFRAGRLEGVHNLSAYAACVARRTVYARRAKDARRRELVDPTYPELSDPPEPADPIGAAHVTRCLTRLADRERSILERTFAWGETSEEIARTLGLTAVAVRVARHRALASLRAELHAIGRVG